MNNVSSKRALWLAFLVILCATLAFAQSDTGFDFRFRERSERRHSSESESDGQKYVGPGTAGNYQRFRLLHGHKHSAVDLHHQRRGGGIQEIRKHEQQAGCERRL